MKTRAYRTVNTLAPLLALFLVGTFFYFKIGGAFFSAANLKLIGAQSVVVAVAAIGMTMVIASGGIDLSVGGVIAFSAAVTAGFLQDSSPAVAIVAGIFAGGAAGLLSGGVITIFKIPPWIATLGMLGVAHGASFLIAPAGKIPATWLNELMKPVPSEPMLLIAPAIWITGVIAIVTARLLSMTIFGRYVFAIGSNEMTVRLCGIRVWLLKPFIYAVSGAFFGFAGTLDLAAGETGVPWEATRIFETITAVVIGGASLRGGTGSILGSMIGALTMGVVRNGASRLGGDEVHHIILGCLLVAVVTLDRFRHGRD